ncbi:metallophosphoesterase, partial [uncultured Duncaniella sp.]|uniref:metallophosphoesterase n=1 Tax=uncultured Duncaniella sp. TaxID=2768039 RepID=UPI0026DEEF2F
MHDTLIAQGFDEENPEHKLIVCGDLMDRGKEARKMQSYILSLLEKNKVILIRGNHEDLMLDMIEDMKAGDPFSLIYSHHASNKTLDTALQLTGAKKRELFDDIMSVASSIAATP